MARRHSLKPQYCREKGRDRAYVRLNGRRHVLGKYESQASRDKYDRLIGEWIASGRAALPNVTAEQARAKLTVLTLIDAWADHACTWYGTPRTKLIGRRPKGELGSYWDPLRELARLYGPTPAPEFGPKALKSVAASLARDRQVPDRHTGAMVPKRGMSRNVVNRHLSRIKSVFKWGVEQELLDGEVYYRLLAVRGLSPGRGLARETEPVAPAAAARG